MNPWDKYATAASAPTGGGPWTKYQTQTAVPDFSAGPKNIEGLYKMVKPDGTPVDVPYSKVMAASGAGWKITPQARETYAQDRFAALQAPVGQPRVSRTGVTNPLEGRFTKGGRMVPQPPLPEETEVPPGLWQKIRDLMTTVATPTGANRPTSLAQTHSLFDTAWNWGANLGDEAQNIAGSAESTIFGAVDTIPQIYSASKDFLTSDQPDKAASGAARLVQMLPPQMATDYMNRLKEEQARNPKYAADDVIGTALGVWATGKATEFAGKTIKAPPHPIKKWLAPTYRPRSVELAGQKVPVLVGEAEPTTRPGRWQTALKKAGVGGLKFDAVSRAQQTAVKNVIRSVAQQTSGLAEPMAVEPGTAMGDAAKATFAQAKPMYAALDKSLVTVPDGLQNVSQITQQAIARAEKLGVDVSDSGITGEYYVDKAGNPVDRGSMSPAKFDDAIRNGDITTKQLAQGQPISTYMKVRSQLLKMKRATADAATRNAISNEISRMNDNMEAALKGTPLYENWLEANRLWLKGYALRDVADAIKASTKGTPAAQQAPGLTPVETRIQGPSLVNRLNGLQEEGILDKAFTPTETANLRQAIDILDRARASVGTPSSFTRGYSPRSVFWHTILRSISFPLVNAMTRLDGLEALKAADAAKTPGEFATAMKKLAMVSAASSAARQQTKSLKQLRDEAKKNLKTEVAPGTPGPQSSALPYTHIYDEASGQIVPA